MIRFQLNVSQLGQIPEKVEVWCKTAEEEDGEGEELQVGENYQAVLDQVMPDTEYLCHGQVSLTGGEILEIPQTVVYTQGDVRVEVEVEEITQDSFRYEAELESVFIMYCSD